MNGMIMKDKLINQTYEEFNLEKLDEKLCEWYFQTTRKILNLNNPITFNEKIQWLKVYDISDLKTKLTDKYEVRHWIKDKIGEEYLIPLLGVWNDSSKIQWDTLPEKFVLKATHGSGWNILITDKQHVDKHLVINKIDQWLKKEWFYLAGLELQYKNIPPRIIAEQYLDNSHGDLFDYKVFCFNGKAKYIMFVKQRFFETKSCFYDLQWNKQNFTFNFPIYEGEVKKPKRLQEMIQLAEELAKDFIHVRVDFYVLNDDTIKFGEMTFTTTSGTAKWIPEEADKHMGDLIVLPRK